MESIEDIKISGLDPKRPPRIQSIPCIDLFFLLETPAPKGWCDEFNLIVSKPKYSIKIDPAKGDVIETWVRHADEIAAVLEKLKLSVAACNRAYQAVVDVANKPKVVSQSGPLETPEQIYLNEVVLNLNFESVPLVQPS